jgi:hypothetical protein
MTTLWYIWKARNDARFKNTKWSVLHVHHATTADMRLTANEGLTIEGVLLQNTNQSGECSNARHNYGSSNQGTNFLLAGNAEDRSLPGPPHYKVVMPAILPGTRCYADAALAPDNPLQVSRKAGLGIFIVGN